jgi:hypothetical protein
MSSLEWPDAGPRAHALARGDGLKNRPRLLDADTEHVLKNHMAIILGYCELLLADTPEDDPRHGDLGEMYRAANAVLAMFSQGSAR